MKRATTRKAAQLTEAHKQRIEHEVANQHAELAQLVQYPEYVLQPFLDGIFDYLEKLSSAGDYDTCHMAGGDFLAVLHGLSQAHGHLERAANVYADARLEHDRRKAERAAEGGAS